MSHVRRPNPTVTARALAAGLVLLALSPATGRAAVPVLVIDGRGFGHGVGLAQDGALAMGRAGANTAQILGHFYPGTALGRAGGTVRVAVFSAPDRTAVLAFPGGGEVRDDLRSPGPGFPVTVPPGGQVRISFDGRYRVTLAGDGPPSPTTTTAPPTTTPASTTTTSTTTTAIAALPPGTGTTVPPTTTTTTTATTTPPGSPPERWSERPLWALPAAGATVAVPARGRRYLGVIEAVADQGPLRLVNQLDVEDYLRGLGEVRDPSWPQASLRAQAIAARTYALRAMAKVGEICDDQRCQVYLGQQAAYPAMDRAVAATRGQVVVAGRGFAATVYSANGGGVSATPEEGFGTPNDRYPYLRAAPYPTADPRPWTVRVALRDVAARTGYPGALTDARVVRVGPSGRAVAVALTGTAGERVVGGIAFARALGLRSTFFGLHVEVAADAPPPPAGSGAALQDLPDVAAPRPAPPPDPPLDAALRSLGLKPAPPPAPPARRAEVGAARPGGLPDPPDRRPWIALAVFALAVVGSALGASCIDMKFHESVRWLPSARRWGGRKEQR
jgi:SpoIID/LytB domain protein